MTKIRAESSAKSHPNQELGNRTIVLSPCMTLPPSSSARPTTAKGDRLLQACRDILDGPDTAGRRWLTRQLRGDFAPHGAMSLGASLPLLGLERIATALYTPMRRGELLNVTWADVDFTRLTISVSPKQDTAQTWEWRIKDAERRTLPLTSELAELLTARRTGQTKLRPYVFISPARYECVQKLREQGQWTVRHGRCPVNNFDRGFRTLLERAQIDTGEFHDLRRTCLSRWLANGLTEYDVMQLAGHSDFSTTHRFYLAVRTDLIDRARTATRAAMGGDFGTRADSGQKGIDGSAGKWLQWRDL